MMGFPIFTTRSRDPDHAHLEWRVTLAVAYLCTKREDSRFTDVNDMKKDKKVNT